MFKEAITKATNKVFSGLKQSGSYLGGLALQEGTAAIARRSPMLGGYADKVLNNIQATRSLNKIRAANAKSYIETADNDTSKEFKEKVKKEQGPGASDKAIEKDMVSILTKLQKLVDKNGQEETKKTEFYKTYEKYFEDYKKHEEEAIKASKQQKEPAKEKADAEKIDETEIPEGSQLDNIETNTKDTVEALNKLVGEPGQGKETTVEANPGFKDALNLLGGKVVNKIGENLLTKLFPAKKEEDAISGKAIDDADITSTIEPKKDGIVSALDELNNKPKDNTNPLSSTQKDGQNIELVNAKIVRTSTNEFLSDQDQRKEASDKESASENKKLTTDNVLNGLIEKLSKSIDALAESVKEKIKDRIDPVKDTGPDLDLPDTPDLKRRRPNLSGARGLAGAASSYALPALGVAAAGAVGYGAGTLLNEGISSGLTAMTGKETTLGGWLYDKFNDDPNSPEAQAKYAASPEGKAQLAKTKAVRSTGVTPAATVTPAPAATVTPAKSVANQVATTAAALNSKETAEAKPSAPIIVNNSTTMNGGGGGGGGGVIAASPIRNTESSFERVQMQDFWPRAA